MAPSAPYMWSAQVYIRSWHDRWHKVWCQLWFIPGKNWWSLYGYGAAL